MDTDTASRAPTVPLTDAQANIRSAAAALASEFADRHREVRLSAVEGGTLHPELWSRIAAEGWPGLLVPREHGGVEGGLLACALVLEELAARNLVFWTLVLDAAIGHAIAVNGPESARARWLPGLAAGETHFGLAVTEPEVGHNVFRTRTTVGRGAGGFVVDGWKAITSATDLADRVLVFGAVPGEEERRSFTTVLVPPEAAGLKRTEIPMGGREGVRQFRLDFDAVEVGEDELVGEEGQGLLCLWPSTHVERILLAALAVGNARYCLERSLQRATSRNVFGKHAIGAEQAIQHPLAGLRSRLQAAQLQVHHVAARFDAGVDSLLIAGEANMAKVVSSELLFDAADQAMQTLGAAAWDEREGMVDLYLDARLSRSAPISQELALDFVARHVLGLPTQR